VEDVKRLNCEDKEIEAEQINIPCYIRKEVADFFKLNGIPLKLPGYYSFEDVKIGKITRKIRNFQWLDYSYVERDNIEEGGRITFDEEGAKVWWCMPNQAHLKI
jgi:hypothetical protein